jgi:hypothetical protein
MINKLLTLKLKSEAKLLNLDEPCGFLFFVKKNIKNNLLHINLKFLFK